MIRSILILVSLFFSQIFCLIYLIRKPGLPSVVLIFLSTVGFFYFLYSLKPGFYEKEIRWNWDEININASDIAQKIHKRTPNFIFGTATSSHQVEGNCDNNQWWDFEHDTKKQRIHNGDKSGEACKHYELYKQDVGLLKKELNVHTYRFSLEWSKIQPEMGGPFDKKVVQHYHDVIDELLKNNIQPMVTIHHFTDPIWFTKIGAFEKEENLDYFVKYGLFVFEQYSPKVKLWCTINEPNVYAYGGYLDGIFPPGLQKFDLGIKTVKNMLIAHTELYHRLKDLPNGRESQIGIVHNLHQFDPYHFWNPIDVFMAFVMDYTYNEVIIQYFKTGRFNLVLPFLVNENYFNPKAKGSFDFYGINYYSHFNVKANLDPLKPFLTLVRPEFQHLVTQMKYAVYGEGMYRILHRISNQLNSPIYVTENGCPDEKDDFLRETYIKRYLYGVSKAMEEGVHLSG
jgi:beta-glucosidase